METLDLAAPFGAFVPRGLSRLLIGASRHTPLGHGEPRKLIWRLLRNAGGDCFDVLVRGARMRLRPFDNSVERVLLLRPLKYCPEELGFLAHGLAKGSTLVDVGANVGAMLLAFARLPGVRVVAVEPVPQTVERLRFNVGANGYSNVEIAPVALSDTEGSVRLFANARDSKLSGIGRSGRGGEEIVVRAKTFAALLADHHVREPYVLKIDVEGHEDTVLMPFFTSSPADRWPTHVLIETIGHERAPACLSFMLANGYRETLRTRQNTGLSRLGA